MALLICPECGAENEVTAERCQQCNASLAGVEPLQSFDQENGDTLPSPEEDLPGLLNALKNEGEPRPLKAQEEEGAGDAVEDAEEIVPEEDVPEWLLRIRQRAQEEKDALGPITKKISAAEDSLLEDNREMQRQNFESWIRQIKEEAQDEEAESIDAFVEEEMPEWLRKIRQSRESPTVREEDAASEGQEQPMSMPDWFGTRDVEPIDGKPDEAEVAAQDEPGLTGETIQVPTDAEAEEISREVGKGDAGLVVPFKPVLSVSPEEERQADHFSAAIAAESLPKKRQEKAKKPSQWLTRVIFDIGLIIIMVLLALWGGNADLSGHSLQPHNEAVLSWSKNLPTQANILVVMDFQPGFYSELSMIAKPLINTIVTSERDFFVLSSVPAGRLLFDKMINELGLETSISIQDLGYFPIAAYGAFGLGGESDPSWEIVHMPPSEKALPVADYNGILVMADSIMGSKAWVEQLSALMPENEIYLFLTAQAGPMLLPYWGSGQVSGMISGISEAVGIESVLAQSSAIADRWQLYQVGIWLMLAVLAVSPFLRNKGANNNNEGQGRK